ncbi:hypothetical protein WJX81_006146 [Elliptochloris bilobata]|uniref:Phospholipid/glycerol acyltransferase domain-containing protein n=1 Tax=Elliptochloris bilobata TaxID=381761 RepID=A0AAW1RRX4_9CHLO
MPSANLLQSQPQLAAVSVKGYRELLRRLRAEQAPQGAAEERAASTLLQQAKERVLLYAQKKRRAGFEPLDPRRAFARLAERWGEARQELKELKDLKKQQWKATVANAVRGQRSSKAEPAPSTRGLTALSAEEQAVLGRDGLVRTVVMAMVGSLSRAFMHGLCSTRIEGAEVLHAALDRPPGQGLITVSNHVAALDDPLVVSALLPPGALGRPGALRWTMCATDRCFRTRAAAAFFRAGKVLPVERGAGLAQPGMRAAEACLANGDWLHIFPEGTRTRDGRLGPSRKGVGRLVATCPHPPLVVPFVHSGMERVVPKGSALPATGQSVGVLVGPPVPMADLLSAAAANEWPEERLYAAIAERVGGALAELKARLDGLPVEQVVRAGSWGAAGAGALVPLIEGELDQLMHPLPHCSVRQSSGLPPISARAQEAAAAAYARGAAAPWQMLRGWDEAAAYTAVRMQKMSAMIAARSDAEFLAREVLAAAFFLARSRLNVSLESAAAARD